MLNVIGIDLGGTRMRVAEVDPDGHELSFHVEQVDHERAQGEATFAQLLKAIERANQGRDPTAIGLAVTGPLNMAAGAIDNPFTLPPELNGPVVDAVRARFGCPTVLINDADAAALGEWWRGAGRGSEVEVCVTVGTGIGVGVVRDGCAQVGANLVHAEAGHHVIDPGGPECYCGARGCWEQLCAGPAIARAMGDGWTAERVAESAHGGDRKAQAVMERAGESLGLGLVNVIAFHAPDTIVLTGSVMKSADLLVPPARSVLERAHYLHAERTQIKVGELGDHAGVLGAARAALDAIGSPPESAGGGSA